MDWELIIFNEKRTPMNYMFRLPRFPLVVDVGDRLICAKDRPQLERKLAKINLTGEEGRRIVDATAEGFTFYPHIQVVTPSLGIRRWKKQQIIDLYNEKRALGAPELGSASLGSRTLQRIVFEVVELLAQC